MRWVRAGKSVLEMRRSDWALSVKSRRDRGALYRAEDPIMQIPIPCIHITHQSVVSSLQYIYVMASRALVIEPQVDPKLSDHLPMPLVLNLSAPGSAYPAVQTG